MFFSSTVKKNFAKWYVCFSLLVQEQTVLISTLDILLFSSVDLTRLNFFNLFYRNKKRKNLNKFDFKILIWINHNTAPHSNGVQKSANTENQIYSTRSIGSVIIYPSAMTKTLVIIE